jgi:hypothetical protein
MSTFASPAGRQPWGRQFWTLSRRYVAVIVSDRVNVALLVLQAPLLGVIILLAAGEHGFEPHRRGAEAYQALLTAQNATLLLVVSATYLGAGNAIREIVKEYGVYQRERAAGLSVSAYVASKIAVLSLVALGQTAVLVLLGTARQGSPPAGAALISPRLELYAALSLTCLAAMGLGLLVSAMARNADKALTLLPLLLVPQLVLSLPSLGADQQPGLREMGYLASAQWGVAAVSSTVHMNQFLYDFRAADPRFRLPGDAEGDASQLHAIRPRWDHTRRAWSTDMLWLAALLVVEVLATGVVLRLRDPARQRS